MGLGVRLMKLPWTRETREDADYSDAVIAAILAQAQGNTGLVQANVGAVAAAAGWWARAFS